MISISIRAIALVFAIGAIACSSYDGKAARDSAAATAATARADSLRVAQDTSHLPPGRLRIKVTEDVPHRSHLATP